MSKVAVAVALALALLQAAASTTNLKQTVLNVASAVWGT
jgi:hypothetical protein